MATFWTRRKDNVAKDERTATPWQVVTDAATVSPSDKTSTSEIVPKQKPENAKVYNTESPK
ncbi:hypothetical protein HPS57_04910 [Prevotella sp. PINT]|jgi:hypothetical protein|uniref:hypothetical protein n=1 Tax=Palleniella intestinalis TaxID=2736291 RepID=UPI0015560AB5|nr:hypothetical protein [Palleniella intestinalis]NPD81310.1 hypothetical protein [Palleniella intestinalis]